MTSNRPKIAIHDLSTGENIVRDMTDEELAQHEIDMAKYAAEENERLAKIAAREAALAKLGLTAEEIAALA
jgi:hypothetical protein